MADSSKAVKRRKITHKRPNPLFEEWLTEWRDEAKEKGFQTFHSYNKALKSLKQYPLPLKSGKECNFLKSFGTKLCSMLDSRLEEFIEENPDDPRLAVLNNGPAVPIAAAAPKAAPRKRAAATSPKKKKPAAKKTNGDANDEVMLQSAPPVYIPTGQAQVKLLVDSSETNAATKKASQKATMKELQGRKIPFEIRDLSIGDFLWLAVAPNGSELVLPFIVERKRSDDLANSIKGSRYHEQKMRLKACGLNVIYLFEASIAHISLPQETLYQAQTNTEIQDKFCVHNTANVKETVSYLASMTRMLQSKIKNKCVVNCADDQEPEYSMKAHTLRLYAYIDFKNGSAKIEDFTVKEMFAQHLLQISGTSPEAVCAIVQKFPTLALMREAFSNCESNSEKIGLLTVLQFGNSRKSLPYEVAKRIVSFYTVYDFSSL